MTVRGTFANGAEERVPRTTKVPLEVERLASAELRRNFAGRDNIVMSLVVCY